MGAIKKRNIFIGIAIVILLWLVYIFQFRKFDNIRLELIYNNKSFPNSKFSFDFLLKNKPNFYDRELEEFSLENTNTFNLISINRKRFPGHHNYILLHDKLKNKESILKNGDSLFYHFLYVNGYTQGLSSQVDLKTFNRYLRLTKTKGKEEIINRFCNLFNEYEKGDRIRTDSSFFKIINKGFLVIDVDTYTDNYEKDTVKINREEGIKGVKRGNIYYIWLKNHGLYKFDFLINHDSLEYVNDQFLGYTGQEKRK